MTPEEIIQKLGLQPHPKERGYFVETYRSPDVLSKEILPLRYSGRRNLATAIYFLLKEGSFSEIHRLQSDELFHFYLGSPAEVVLLDSSGKGRVVLLGNDFGRGQVPQLTIPQGCWQGMRSTGAFTLLGCTVSPGFDYEDYESGSRAELLQKYPDWEEWIVRLT